MNAPFSRQDVEDAVRFGDDSQDNSVVVTLTGKIKVVTLDEAQRHPEKYAVRHETFDAGNDYIGPDASNHKKHIDSIYENLLNGWAKHLHTGSTSVYVDGTE